VKVPARHRNTRGNTFHDDEVVVGRVVLLVDRILVRVENNDQKRRLRIKGLYGKGVVATPVAIRKGEGDVGGDRHGCLRCAVRGALARRELGLLLVNDVGTLIDDGGCFDDPDTRVNLPERCVDAGAIVAGGVEVNNT